MFTPVLVPDTTPKATVQAFVAAIRAHDAPAAVRRVLDGKATGIPLTTDMTSLRLTSLGEERIDGDTATVEVDAALDIHGTLLRAEHETVHLHQANEDWKIVPAAQSFYAAPGTRGERPPLVAGWARVVTDSVQMTRARDASIRAQGLTKSKNIALATIFYSADHGDRLPTAAQFRAAVAPYLGRAFGNYPRGSDPFAAPGAPRGTTYFLDPRLSGRSLTSIDHISEVAMIVMGKDGRATYPYLGQTVISFADGHTMRAKPIKAYRARTIPLG